MTFQMSVQVPVLTELFPTDVTGRSEHLLVDGSMSVQVLLTLVTFVTVWTRERPVVAVGQHVTL